MKNYDNLLKKAGINFLPNVPLYKYSTIKVGGPAKYFVEVKTPLEAENIFKFTLDNNIPMFVLGGGSNVLISDKGFDGVVLKNNIMGIEFLKREQAKFVEKLSRKEETNWTGNLLSLNDINYSQSSTLVFLKISSGIGLPYALTFTIEKDATGLEIFAGIPGTIGGALWNNVHGAKWLIGQFVKDITFIDSYGNIQTKTPEELHFEYNFTDFHNFNSFILSATFMLFEGGKQKAREVANEWISRKKIQPKNSLGSVFSNLTEDQKLKLGLENLSAGYVIDKILGLKGLKIGGAQISESHSNFIITNKGTLAKDYLMLINKIKSECFKKIGIELKEEIVFLGDFN